MANRIQAKAAALNQGAKAAVEQPARGEELTSVLLSFQVQLYLV
jgi:hypothetical protein